MTTNAQTPPGAGAKEKKPANRNVLVIVIVLVALGLMGWAGLKNYQQRKQQEAKLKEFQAMVVKSGPAEQTPGQPAGAGTPANAADDPQFANPLAGKMAPNFTLKDTTGKKVSLSSYRGKAVIVDFWATWCAPCKVEIPWLEKLHDQYAAQGLEVLGVSEDDLDLDDPAKLLKEKQEIADSATKLHINYPVVIDDSNVAKPYGGIDALPTTFFVGRDGMVVAATVGLADRDEIEADIKKALGTGNPSTKGQSE
ncbi:peroxiredoxin [Silvibacterium bohemicum]|uniref:Peroxiredoxin n=1 Tax=Silvibacterium bohemicum TaxID=1577686 RepID=A0A841JRY2_9BACT|nr:TlpA disulfide reductase family protein [Silvibacterium bohemicum]MBB6142539.1 peroxiredoxin [Silvibacterium bohemicum]